MDAAAFRIALAEAKPTLKSLLDFGLNADEAKDTLSTYDVMTRPSPRYVALPDATLETLLSQYDVSKVEVGILRFCNLPEPVSDGWIIGEVEADPLVLDSTSGEIVVKDIAAPTQILCRCAKDGSRLLAALAEAARYFETSSWTDEPEAAGERAAKERCTALAGGDSYASFFRMLFGVV